MSSTNEEKPTAPISNDNADIPASAGESVSIYDRFPKIYNIFLVGIVACISGLMFGFDISSMSSMVDADAYKDFFQHPSAGVQGVITAAMAAGSFFGSLLSPSISDTFGRRVSLHSCSLLWIIGSVIQAITDSRGMLILGRLVSGLGIGFGSSIAPVYCSEISPPKIRGAIGGIFQLFITIGIMIMFYIGYGFHVIEGTNAFRLTWAMQVIPGVILFCAVFFLPESPRWLAVHGKWKDAVDVVSKVSSKGDVLDPYVQLQLEEIREQLIVDKVSKGFSYFDLFRKKTLPKITVGIFAQAWQQLCGMNVIMYYVVFVFQMAGYKGNVNLISSSINYVLNVLTTLPALYLVDRLGRRPVLMVGGVFMALWLFMVAGLLGKYSEPLAEGYAGNDAVRISIPPERAAAGKAVIAAAYLFVCSFAPSWGVGIWIYCSEIFNNIERAKGSALCTAVNWAFNFALAMFVPSAFKNITWRTFIIFGCFSLALTVHTYFQFPETKGKTLEEIDQMWASGVPAWHSASFVPEIPSYGITSQAKDTTAAPDKTESHNTGSVSS